ncbi:MAG: hypothetical protein HRT47_13335 [Candidatus Caenarcaniphilales bacterium]|nr:hypothetical protein [Candidatus Caenarcaniphilales bacterium]
MLLIFLWWYIVIKLKACFEKDLGVAMIVAEKEKTLAEELNISEDTKNIIGIVLLAISAISAIYYITKLVSKRRQSSKFEKLLTKAESTLKDIRVKSKDLTEKCSTLIKTVKQDQKLNDAFNTLKSKSKDLGRNIKDLVAARR